jgi:hypothetical protein
MIKPEKYPDWCMKNNKNGFNNTLTKQEYPQEKINDGWDIDEVPAREWENYKNYLTSIWLRYLDEKTEKISTVGVPVGVALPTFPSLGGYKCVALEVADSYGFVLCNGQEIKDKDSVFFGKKVPNLNANNILKGSAKDNEEGGNKLNKANFDHTHNYDHTHKVFRFKVNNSSINHLQFLLNSKENKEKESWDYILSFNNGSSASNSNGTSLQLISKSTDDYITTYTSGVNNKKTNGDTSNAQTKGISNYNDLNIEPQNISTIYIIRIK